MPCVFWQDLLEVVYYDLLWMWQRIYIYFMHGCAQAWYWAVYYCLMNVLLIYLCYVGVETV